jgi:hypothetical protein
MQDEETGVSLTTHFSGFQIYTNCFVGSELVDWMLDQANSARIESAKCENPHDDDFQKQSDDATLRNSEGASFPDDLEDSDPLLALHTRLDAARVARVLLTNGYIVHVHEEQNFNDDEEALYRFCSNSELDTTFDAPVQSTHVTITNNGVDVRNTTLIHFLFENLPAKKFFSWLCMDTGLVG